MEHDSGTAVSTSKARAHILRLPVELTLKLFNEFDDLLDAIALSNTCHRLRQVLMVHADAIVGAILPRHDIEHPLARALATAQLCYADKHRGIIPVTGPMENSPR